MKSDPYAIPPVYDPADVKTLEEYRAQAALMGYVFDWRDGTFCEGGSDDAPRCWLLDEATQAGIAVPDDIDDLAVAIDCVTGAVIGAHTTSLRRAYYGTDRRSYSINPITHNFSDIPWIRYPAR
jgi:hypothetical protein